MLADLADLPATPTWSTDVVAALYGHSTWSLYEIVRNGGGIDLPDGTTIRPHRVGRSLKWPAVPIRRALGLDQSPNGPAPQPGPRVIEQAPDAESSSEPSHGAA